jgi:PP-loop superfamily ATP-utilizing enzyme
MRNISVETKKTVLNLILHSTMKREVLKQKINKNENVSNPCYACIKAFLNSSA